MNKVHIHFVTVFLLSFASLNSVADSEEVIVKSIDEVSALWVGYKSSLYFEKSNTYVSLYLEMSNQSHFIKSFLINTDWGEISVPSDILLKLKEPQFNTIEISYTPLDVKDPDWAFSIRFFYGTYVQQTDKDRDNFNMVEISVDKNSLIDLTVFEAKTDSTKLLFSK